MDKVIKCQDCGEDFNFSEKEQELKKCRKYGNIRAEKSHTRCV